MSITIRTAQEQDAPAIRIIYEVAFSLYQAQLGFTQRPAALAETIEQIAQATHEHAMLLAVYNTLKPVGTIRISWAQPGLAYISRFAVLPNWQKSGAGSALLQAALEHCQRSGAHAVALHTGAALKSLVHLYGSFGFTLHSTQDTGEYIRGLYVKTFHPGYTLPETGIPQPQ